MMEQAFKEPTVSTSELVFTVNNSERLRGTSSFSRRFGPEGGTIGSGEAATWRVTVGDGGMPEPVHAEIRMVEGVYCLIDRSQEGTFLNGAATRCGLGVPVRLESGDKVRVGDLQLSVEISHAADDPFQATARAAVNLDGVTGANPYRDVAPGTAPKEPLQHNPLLDGGNPLDIEDRHKEPMVQSKTTDLDPIVAFPDSESEMRLERDPLALFDRTGVARGPKYNKDELLAGAPEGEELGVWQQDLTGSIHAAVVPAEDASVDEDALRYLERLEGEDDAFAASTQGLSAGAEEAIDHVALRPLLKALGLDISTMNAAQAEQFLTEVGLVLRETVAAMVDLYASAPGNGPVESRLNASCVLPLEDNPMRLAKTVDEGVENLFFIQNPVQLSPSDAIRECFGQIKDHQRFTEMAADQGLQSTLKVFDPAVLSKRFHAYAEARRDPRPRDASWHWDMYQKYYAELSAKRQDGLRRIFWQVFERAYDQSVRNQPSIY